MILIEIQEFLHGFQKWILMAQIKLNFKVMTKCKSVYYSNEAIWVDLLTYFL